MTALHRCSHTFDAMAPPAQLFSWRCDTRISGSPSAAPISRQPSVLWSMQQAQPLASNCRMLACAPSKRGGGNGAPHSTRQPGHDSDHQEVAERHNGPLPPHYLKIFMNGLAVRMFQYGDYTLILPAHASG